MITDIFLLLIGFVLLIGGAEYVVRGASSIAARLNVSPLVIGLTIVAFGTSAPELTVNVLAALRGSTDLAISNVVGSNIANILLVLGVAAIITPLKVKSNTVWKEIPFALLGIILLFIMGNDTFLDNTTFNALTRTDGLALLAIFIIFLYYIYSLAKNENYGAEEKVKQYNLVASSGIFIGGLIALIAGGQFLVNGAVDIATTFGVSETLIGVSIIALGTSLPELATTVAAVRQGHRDVAIGNIVGSNIFNIFWILGVTSVIAPIPFSAAINADIMVGIGASLLLFIFMFTGKRHYMNRLEGITFLSFYALYISYVVIRG